MFVAWATLPKRDSFWSPALGKQGGVAILISKDFQFSVSQWKKDTSGRLISVLLHLGDQRYNFLNVYAPTNPRERKKFFNTLHEYMFPNSIKVIGGDFNSFESDLDKFGGNVNTSTDLKEFRPVMFLTYMNNIPDIITSTAKLFADDTKIYRQINNVEDSIAFQIDLTTLNLWADHWEMKFNPTKCEVMRISHNKDKRSTRYNISGTELRNVSNYKDLGVIMASDLKWSKHVEQIVHKANRVLGLFKRTVGGKNKDIFSNLYKTLVRPILEYACLVWSPHQAKDIHEIEKIQRRALRIALNQRRQEMAYEERCRILK